MSTFHVFWSTRACHNDLPRRERALPRATAEGDVLVLDSAGAYGACMSSAYNLRSPARELIIDL